MSEIDKIDAPVTVVTPASENPTAPAAETKPEGDAAPDTEAKAPVVAPGALMGELKKKVDAVKAANQKIFGKMSPDQMKQRVQMLQDRRRQQTVKAVSKVCKDHIAVAPFVGLKPVTVQEMRNYALNLMLHEQLAKHLIPTAISIAPIDSKTGTKLGFFTFHYAPPRYDKKTNSYTTSEPPVEEAPEGAAKTEEQTSEKHPYVAPPQEDKVFSSDLPVVMTKFPGMVFYRDRTMAVGDPDGFFAVVVQRLIAASHKLGGRPRSIRRKFGL